jgi:hypothetical protein
MDITYRIARAAATPASIIPPRRLSFRSFSVWLSKENLLNIFEFSHSGKYILSACLKRYSPISSKRKKTIASRRFRPSAMLFEANRTR